MSRRAREKWENRALAYRKIRSVGGAANAELYRERFRQPEKIDAALEAQGNFGAARKSTSH